MAVSSGEMPCRSESQGDGPPVVWATRPARVLVIGYGNPGRQDDGLGPAAAAQVAAWNLPGVETEVGYQLQIEDALTCAAHDAVVFVDADAAGPEPFGVHAVEPSQGIAFSSHVVPPEVVLGICRRFYETCPSAWVLGIRGYAFELEESLTPVARANLQAAVDYLRRLLS